MKNRLDVDGLRSIAVGSIILYHFGYSAFGGGYVGVDVFFVISGYLIGPAAINQIFEGTFSFGAFIERRARRLFPALIAMLVATTIMSYLILLPFDLRNFGKSVIGTATYISNIIFFREAGYFDQAAIYKPLLHTWSLAVEEQFYLTFPPLILALRHFSATRRTTERLIITLLLLSLGLAQLFLAIDPSASFYLLPFRAWEFLAGVSVGFIDPRWLSAISRAWRDLAAILGSLLIVVPIFSYTHDTPFPGIAALPAVAGTALLIVAGSGSGASPVVTRLLSLPPFAFVGRISYSLYLWHWPIAVGLTYYFAGSMPPLVAITGIVATGLLSMLSWRFIEEPFRRRRRLPEWRPLFRLITLSSCTLVAVGCTLYKSEGAPGRFSPAGQEIAVASGDFLQNGGVCFEPDNQIIPGLALCQLGDRTTAPSFLVWGDSHGRAFRDGIDLAAREAGRSGLLVWGAGCPPLFGVRKIESAASPAKDAQCLDQTNRLAAFLATNRSLRTVLLVGRWAYYTNGQGIGVDAHNIISIRPTAGGVESGAMLFAHRMQATVEQLREQDRRVLILEQVPEISGFNARSFAQYVLSRGEAPDKVLAQIGILDQSLIDQRQKAATDTLDALQKKGDATVIRTHTLFCRHGKCYAWIDGRPALFDNNHITVHTSLVVRGIFHPLFG